MDQWEGSSRAPHQAGAWDIGWSQWPTLTRSLSQPEDDMEYNPEQGHGLPRDPFKALVMPRPIGWITTLAPNGQVNLAPYSFFNAVSTNPPIVMFVSEVSGNPDIPVKDTAHNAESTGEFVCNLVTFALREQMNKTSAAVDEDEMRLAGLTPTPSSRVAPPRVGESPVHIECRYLQTIRPRPDNPDSGPLMVLGEAVCIHIDDSILTDGRVDYQKMRPIARLGYMDYTVVDQIFQMDRPS